MRDIDKIVATLTGRHRGLMVDNVGAPGGGTWYIRRSLGGPDVRLESGTGNCPFLFSAHPAPGSREIETIADAVAEIERRLGLVE